MLCETVQLSNPLKLIIEVETSRTVVGSEFQINGADAEKLRFPYLVVLHRSSARSPWAAERRWRCVELVDMGWHMSARYGGATWRRTTHSLVIEMLLLDSLTLSCKYYNITFYTDCCTGRDNQWHWTEAMCNAKKPVIRCITLKKYLLTQKCSYHHQHENEHSALEWRDR